MSLQQNRSALIAFRTVRNQRGMTLIEIMIVIAIIAGLMAVLGANVNNARKRAAVENTKLAMTQISKQLEAYSLSCGSYPTTEQGLQALLKNPGAEVCANWGPEPYYKKESELKDQWGKTFLYESDGSKFVIRSLGSDRKEGGEADAKDLSTEE